MDNDRLELLGRVATWYYEDNLDQTLIAKRIGRSRSMVSRMLQEARQQGVVEIKVNYPLKTDLALENRFCELFDLKQAVILNVSLRTDYLTLLRRLGTIAARSLQQKLHNNICIGIGWGSSVQQTIYAMPKMELMQATILPLTGSVGHSEPMVDGTDLAQWLSQKLNADYRFLPAPLLVKEQATAQSLQQHQTVSHVFSLAHQVEVALIGIGTLNHRFSSLYRLGYLNDAELADLKDAGAVGNILAYHLDIFGNVIDVPLNRCVISLSLDILRKIPQVIAVAGSVAKAAAILGALRSGCLDIMITDTMTASQVLELEKKTRL